MKATPRRQGCFAASTSVEKTLIVNPQATRHKARLCSFHDASKGPRAAQRSPTASLHGNEDGYEGLRPRPSQGDLEADSRQTPDKQESQVDPPQGIRSGGQRPDRPTHFTRLS